MKTITIGRSSHCDIVIADERVSRVHAEITLVIISMYIKMSVKTGVILVGVLFLMKKS